MTAEHLRILLDCERASHALYEAAVGLARADVPREILDALRLGQQYAVRVEKATSPFNTRCPPERGQNVSLTLCRP